MTLQVCASFFCKFLEVFATFNLIYFSWGATGWVFDLQLRGHGFNSHSGHGCVTTLGKLFTPLCLSYLALNERLCFAVGKVLTVDLA